ncbi:J domain-containing protein [Massilia sp. TS11]|nr:J domain-containing protein [Massilia sp. TS11]
MEVIRAAYKALSQKYHPDKNPGDEKAARIMAIINTAYGTLSDPQRRKEHDEWIAAEEWEVEWLESTHGDEPAHPKGKGEAAGSLRRAKWLRGAKWTGALAACFALGCVAGVLAVSQSRSAAPSVLAHADPRSEPLRPVAKAEAPDRWAARPFVTDKSGNRVPEFKVLAVSQLAIPARAPDCDADQHLLVAPNGEPWPTGSGYVAGYPVANKGDEVQLIVDNSANSSPVFVKVYDLEHRANVRHIYVLPNERFEVDHLAAGKYELRYQNVAGGADASQCPRKPSPITQAAAG